jgi:AGZA family xanthine/uracil permease-like MFS transporter
MYIGHPGWKALGGRIGYSLGTGIAAAGVCLLGILSLLLAIIPVWAILPILVYIGAVIGSQAFQTSPARHAPAIVLALIPNIAQWAQTLVDNATLAAGSNPVDAGLVGTFEAPIYYQGMATLGGGAILVGLLWAAIAIFVIDRKWKEAVIYSLIAAVLSYFGFIHGTQIAMGAAWQMAVGYLILAALFAPAIFVKLPEEEEATA